MSKKQIEAVKSDRLNGQLYNQSRQKSDRVCEPLHTGADSSPVAVYLSIQVHGKIITCQGLKTGCNNVVLPNKADSGSTMLNNIVDNYEQCGQHNIVASCFQQP